MIACPGVKIIHNKFLRDLSSRLMTGPESFGASSTVKSLNLYCRLPATTHLSWDFRARLVFLVLGIISVMSLWQLTASTCQWQTLEHLVQVTANVVENNSGIKSCEINPTPSFVSLLCYLIPSSFPFLLWHSFPLHPQWDLPAGVKAAGHLIIAAPVPQRDQRRERPHRREQPALLLQHRQLDEAVPHCQPEGSDSQQPKPTTVL